MGKYVINSDLANDKEVPYMTIASRLRPAKTNYYLRTFLWAFGLAFAFFLPWIIWNAGYFFFYGDYNVQQIPFYQMIHDTIRNGNIGWSYTTDLGANIIGSYSFYMFGSPFFWLTLLFPSEAVPYLMAPLLMLKFALAALGAYTFLRRYVSNQHYAVLGAIAYAFSGFGIYNVFFNHFHEAMVAFPFLLAAVDAFIYERRKGVVAYAVFAAVFMNYYFFAGQAVFVFLYWVVRMMTGSYRMSIKEFLRFAIEVLLGFFAAAVIVFPSVLAVLQNSRVSNTFSGWSGLVYTSEQRYIHIFTSFFFPPDMPAYANFTPDSNAKWASVAAWLPMYSMVGVFAFYQNKTHKWLRVLIPLLFVMAFVPLFNSVFQLLNSAYYARWFYMFTLMLVLATVISLDRQKTDFKPGLKLTFMITLIAAALIGFMPVSSTGTNGETTTSYGLEKYDDRYWLWVAIAMASLVVLMVVLNFRRNQKLFVRLSAVGMSIVIIGYSVVLLGTGVLNATYDKDYIIKNALGNKGAFSDLKDLSNVRSDFYNEMDNMGMYWQIPTIQAFQSIVPGSVMDFYKSVGVERSVGSRPKTDVYAIRSFLSCKYLFDVVSDSKSFATNETYNLMPGWKLLEEKHGYEVYENEYYIPYGFTYDTYVTTEEYEKTEEANRSKLMLKSIVLTEEQAKKYKDILKHDESLESYAYSQSEYYEDCNDRKKLTCSSVKFQNSEFTAQIKTGDSGELVFFSIPYEPGWQASVNGQPAEIEKVNVGFMAVRVPANSNATIRFTYRTPGLMVGLIVSGVSIVLFVVYMLLWKVKRKHGEDGEWLLIDDLAPVPPKKPAPAVLDISDTMAPSDGGVLPDTEEMSIGTDGTLPEEDVPLVDDAVSDSEDISADAEGVPEERDEPDESDEGSLTSLEGAEVHTEAPLDDADAVGEDVSANINNSLSDTEVLPTDDVSHEPHTSSSGDVSADSAEPSEDTPSVDLAKDKKPYRPKYMRNHRTKL